MIRDMKAQVTELTSEVVKLRNEMEPDVVFIDSAHVHKSFDGIYRLPTIFTTWTFSVPREKNPGLNLKGLTEIQLKFSGSFVYSDQSTPITCKLSDATLDSTLASSHRSILQTRKRLHRHRRRRRHRHRQRNHRHRA